MSLEKFRKEIDTLDAKILKLLNQRARCVIKIGEIKREKNREIYVPEREKEIMDRLININQGPLSIKSLQQIFRNIIETMKTLQES